MSLRQSCLWLGTAYLVNLLYSWVMSSSYKTYARVGFFASLMGTWGNKRVKESCRKWKLFWLVLWCSMSVWSRPETARSANGTWNKDLQAHMLRWSLTAQMLSCCIVLTQGRRLLRVFCICLVHKTCQAVESGHQWVEIGAKWEQSACANGESSCRAGRNDTLILLAQIVQGFVLWDWWSAWSRA
jgi:hypothetical protein